MYIYINTTLIMSNEIIYMRTVGKGSHVHVVFKYPLGHIRMTLGPRALAFQEIGNPHSLY